MSRPRQLLMRRPRLDDLPPLPPLAGGDVLRVAGPNDAEALAVVLDSAFGPDAPWNAAVVRRRLLDAPDVVETLLLEANGEPVATAAARLDPAGFPGSGYVHWVGVHADHRGRSLGRIVTLAVLHRFVALGCRDAVLETDPHRIPAIRTYLRLGFVPEPISPEHKAIWRSIMERFGR